MVPLLDNLNVTGMLILERERERERETHRNSQYWLIIIGGLDL